MPISPSLTSDLRSNCRGQSVKNIQFPLDLSHTMVHFLSLDSLYLSGSLCRRGSLGSLMHHGSLRDIGSLTLSGSLFSNGSLELCGSLSWYGSLLFALALTWFALKPWISPLNWFALLFWILFSALVRSIPTDLSCLMVRSAILDLSSAALLSFVSLTIGGSLPIRIELVNVSRMLKDVRSRRLGPELHLVPYLVQV